MKLLLWIYEDDNLREEVLRYCFVERFHETNSSLIENSDMIYVYKDALDSVKKGANDCPIVLENLIFDIFSYYLATRRNKKQTYLSKQT